MEDANVEELVISAGACPVDNIPGGGTEHVLAAMLQRCIDIVNQRQLGEFFNSHVAACKELIRDLNSGQSMYSKRNKPTLNLTSIWTDLRTTHANE